MAKITKVKVLTGYRLELAFDDGVCGVADLSDLVGTGVFALWRDRHVFEQARIGSFGELVWGNQIDLCPDSLYFRVTGKKPEDVFPVRFCAGGAGQPVFLPRPFSHTGIFHSAATRELSDLPGYLPAMSA